MLLFFFKNSYRNTRKIKKSIVIQGKKNIMEAYKGKYDKFIRLRGNDMKKKFFVACVIFGSLGLLMFEEKAQAADVSMHRMYNPNSGEHFYTKDTNEKNNLQKHGWKYEGIGWTAPSTGNPVYRLYNKNAGDHHYTLHAYEKDHLVKVGWKYEGVGWYSDTKKSVPLYRAYNPNAKAGSHNYTVNKNEQNHLIKVGWRNEGIAWYGVVKSTPKPTVVNKKDLQKYYDQYKGTQKGSYTEASWNSFQGALKKAKETLADSKASQSVVNSSTNNLKNAYSALKIQYYKVTIKHVDTGGNTLGKSEESVKKGTNYTAKAKTFNGYSLQGNSSVSMVISSDKTITFTYKKNVNNATVKVRYVDRNGYDIETPTTLTVEKGKSYTAVAKAFSGFKVRGNSSQTKVINSDTTFTFTYDLEYTVIVNHVDSQGRVLDKKTEVVLEGSNYTAVAKNFAGYGLDGEDSQSAVVNYDNYTFTFRYLKKFNVSVDYAVDGTSQVLEKQNYEVLEGKAFNVPLKSFTGYSLFEDGSKNIGRVDSNLDVTINYKSVNDIQNKIRQDIFSLVNTYRRNNQLQALNSVDLLNQGADIRAQEIQTNYSHGRPNGTIGTTVGDEVGYPNYCKTENIWKMISSNAKSAYYNGANELFNSWKGSPTHNSALLMSDLTEVGYGVNIENNQNGTVNIGYVFLGGRPWR